MECKWRKSKLEVLWHECVLNYKRALSAAKAADSSNLSDLAQSLTINSTLDSFLTLEPNLLKSSRLLAAHALRLVIGW